MGPQGPRVQRDHKGRQVGKDRRDRKGRRGRRVHRVPLGGAISLSLAAPISLNIPGMDIVSPVVPPDSYWINYTVKVYSNDNNAEQFDRCSLSTGAQVGAFIPSTHSVLCRCKIGQHSLSTTSTIAAY